MIVAWNFFIASHYSANALSAFCASFTSSDLYANNSSRSTIQILIDNFILRIILYLNQKIPFSVVL